MSAKTNAVLSTIFLGLMLTATAGAQPTVKVDPLQPFTPWKGTISQGADSFPATFFVRERVEDRITGELQFTAGGRPPSLRNE